MNDKKQLTVSCYNELKNLKRTLQAISFAGVDANILIFIVIFKVIIIWCDWGLKQNSLKEN